MADSEMEVLANKVRKAFRFLDLNKNGVLTKEEFVMGAENVCSACNVTGAEREKTCQEWGKWFDMFSTEDEITEQGYVAQNKSFAKNPERAKAENILTYGRLFDIVDVNKDGFISPEELRLYYKAFGYGEDYYIDKIFRILDDNKDGLISRGEFLKAAVTYWSNEPGYEFFYDVPRK